MSDNHTPAPAPQPDMYAIGDDRLVDAVTALAEAGIPTDVQELLIYGNVSAGIPPNALLKALKAAGPDANPRSNVDALTRRLLDVLDNEEDLSDEVLEAFKALDNAVSAAPQNRMRGSDPVERREE